MSHTPPAFLRLPVPSINKPLSASFCFAVLFVSRLKQTDHKSPKFYIVLLKGFILEWDLLFFKEEDVFLFENN